MDLSFRYCPGIICSLLYGNKRSNTGHNRRFVYRLDFNRHFFPKQKIQTGPCFVVGRHDNSYCRFLVSKDNGFYQQKRGSYCFARISLTETTTESRLTIWKMSWQGFKEKPVFGWGQENFNLVFNKYYEPILYKQEPWFDRYNVFFDRLTTNGIFGLLSYIGLLGAALYYLWAKRKNTGLSVEDSAIFGSMFIAYFFNNLFVFDNLISLILFATFLAYVSFRSKIGANALIVNESPRADYGKVRLRRYHRRRIRLCDLYRKYSRHLSIQNHNKRF